MIRPHHKQYYGKAEMQRYKCPDRMLTVLEVVDQVINGKVSISMQHHYYQKLLGFLGFDGSSDLVNQENLLKW